MSDVGCWLALAAALLGVRQDVEFAGQCPLRRFRRRAVKQVHFVAETIERSKHRARCLAAMYLAAYRRLAPRQQPDGALEHRAFLAFDVYQEIRDRMVLGEQIERRGPKLSCSTGHPSRF